LLEYVCNDNERDASHAAGKLSEVKIAPEILLKLAGEYETSANGMSATIKVSVSGDALFFDMAPFGPQKMIATSETTFITEYGFAVEFSANPQGIITQLVFHIVEGDTAAVRKR
jgi:hypothetical protein